MKKIIVYGAAIVAAALALPAFSQEVGVYSGASADGQGISFTVTADPTSGAPTVTAATIFYTAPCTGGSYTLNTGWGFGLNSAINNGRVLILAHDNFYTFNVALSFSKDGQSASGMITSYGVTEQPIGVAPTHSLLCESPKQAFNLTLQPTTDAARAALALAPGASINLGSPK